MLKVNHFLIPIIALIIFSGCFVIDPLFFEPKSGQSKLEGKVISFNTKKSYSDSYTIITLQSKNEKLFFAQSSNLDKMISAQIEINDYIKYEANYTKKIKTLEITKNNENNCKIKIFIEYDQNNRQKINEFAYVINNDKDEEKCSKYSIKEPSNDIRLLRKTNYIK